MSDRWWAPTRPTVTPDAVVLAMCEPGDLGAALLAAHRAGAASIETVATSALPCEETLIDALVAGRGHFVPPVHEAIAKKLEPIYSDLLLRDWLDAAEQSAMTIYRTAVTKGVTPSVAATRAGQVYGVPARELGPYFAKAIDPKTPPVWLVQEADRVLMEHVASVVANEAAEVVTKATMDRPAFQETDVVRDVKGRFADERKPAAGTPEWLKLQFRNAGAPPRVGEMEREEQKVEEVKAKPKKLSLTDLETGVGTPHGTRSARGTRGVRSPRKQAAQAEPGLKERSPKLAERALQPKSVQLTQRGLTEMSALIERQTTFTPKPKVRGGVMRPLPDRRPPETYESLEKNIVLTVSAAESKALRVAAAEHDGHFRMGHLAEPGTAITTAKDSRVSYARSVMARQAESDADRRHEEGTGPAFEDPTVDTFSTSKVDRESLKMGVSDDTWLKEAAETVATAAAREKGTVWGERGNTHTFPLYMAPEFSGEEEGYAIVHYGGKDNARAWPTVDEFVVVNQARGVIEGTSRHQQIVLDPNQTYLIDSPAPTKFWDQDAGVIVNRFYVRAVDNESGYIQKATEFWDETQVKRDKDGQFSVESIMPRKTADWATEEAVSVQTPAKLSLNDLQSGVRHTRGVRGTRKLRRTPVQASPLRERATALTERSGMKERPALQERANPLQEVFRSFERAAPLGEALEKLPMLDAKLDYRLFSSKEWDDIDAVLSDAGATLHRPGMSVRLDPSMVDNMLDSSMSVGAHGMTSMMVDNVIRRQYSGFAMKHIFSENYDALEADPAQMDAFTQRIKGAIAGSQSDLHMVEIRHKGPNLEVYGQYDDEGGGQQSIIQIAEDYSPSAPAVLTYIGTYQATDLGLKEVDGTVRQLVNSAELGIDGFIPTPPVRIYRLSAKRYEIGN